MKPIENFTSLDLEFNQPSGKIIQIGACVGNKNTGRILDSLSVMINPGEILAPFIIELTGITQEDVDKGSSLEDGYQKLMLLHKMYDSFINPVTWGGGDNSELRDQLVIERTPPPNVIADMSDWCFGRRWIDVKTLFISWRFANSQPIQGGLARSMTKVGLRFQGRKHNAMDDAINTFHMYKRMLEIIKNGQVPKGSERP
jgi:inhibitor of KinA sporulation pathway (predicted exonuclease)